MSASHPHKAREYCFILALISVVLNLYVFWAVPHRAALAQNKPDRVQEPVIPAMRSFMNNRPFRILFAASFIVGFCGSLSMGLQTYFFQEVSLDAAATTTTTATIDVPGLTLERLLPCLCVCL